MCFVRYIEKQEVRFHIGNGYCIKHSTTDQKPAMCFQKTFICACSRIYGNVAQAYSYLSILIYTVWFNMYKTVQYCTGCRKIISLFKRCVRHWKFLQRSLFVGSASVFGATPSAEPTLGARPAPHLRVFKELQASPRLEASPRHPSLIENRQIT